MSYDTYAQEDTVKPLLEVTKTALLHDCTLLCAWRCLLQSSYFLLIWKLISITLLLVDTTYCDISCSMTECARYLETIKVYENKPADLIQGQMDTDYLSRVWKLFSLPY